MLTLTQQGFYLNLPLGGATAVLLLMMHIPKERTKEKAFLIITPRQLDLVGFVAFTPSVTMLLLTLYWGRTTYP
jgi:hypothetical protein